MHLGHVHRDMFFLTPELTTCHEISIGLLKKRLADRGNRLRLLHWKETVLGYESLAWTLQGRKELVKSTHPYFDYSMRIELIQTEVDDKLHY